jgi:hypothetical protein
MKKERKVLKKLFSNMFAGTVGALKSQFRLISVNASRPSYPPSILHLKMTPERTPLGAISANR